MIELGDGAVSGLIRSHLDRLSPNDRRIATHILQHPAEAPFETAESLAAKTGVSKAAVVRFSSRVGFTGFAELHDALAAEAITRLRPAVRRTSPSAHPIEQLAFQAAGDLESLATGVDRSQFDAAVGMLCRGHGKIGIFGHRKSAALAEYAYYLLNPLLSNVWPIAAGEPTIADQLIDLEPRDRLLAFTFQRYAKVTGDVVRLFREAGAPVVLITDDLLAPAAGQANHVLVCQGQRDGFASAATSIVVLEALAAAIALRKGGARNPRMDTAEQLWKQFGTY
jgi:DNA-binding MurR/RpiR family transcriptional regulator